MKKLFYLIVVTIVSVVFIQSCKKAKPKFSCNPAMETYFVSSKISYQNISREDLVKMGKDTQFAIFRSLTPLNKKRIFNEKIDLLLKIENFSIAEKNHLISLRNYFSESMYGREEDDLDPFLNNWESNATSQLGWDEDKIQGYVGTWMMPMDVPLSSSTIHYQQVDKEGGTGGSGLKPNCNCRYSASCWWITQSCVSECETPPNGGCGIVGTANCTGVCKTR